MNSIRCTLFFSAMFCSPAIFGFDGITPKSNNEIPRWEQQKPSVAKYVDGKYSNTAQNSSRRLFGVHVCARSKIVMVPVRQMQSYCKPVYQSYLRRCESSHEGLCTGYRVVYELAYRSIQRLMPKTESIYECCPGWQRKRVYDNDCKKAICRESCQNGGLCIKPDHCLCPPGWTGKTCETDVDECSVRRHGCEHQCIDLRGSYRCACREGFTLQEDRRSCKKDEAKRSTENDCQLLEKIDQLQQRLSALEEWQRKMNAETRHPREDQINSLSEQMAILEETLEECSCYRRSSLALPKSQK